MPESCLSAVGCAKDDATADRQCLHFLTGLHSLDANLVSRGCRWTLFTTHALLPLTLIRTRTHTQGKNKVEFI